MPKLFQFCLSLVESIFVCNPNPVLLHTSLITSYVDLFKYYDGVKSQVVEQAFRTAINNKVII